MRRPGYSPAPADPVVSSPSLERRPLTRSFARLGGLALALGLTGGCGAPCEQLREFVCDGGDAAYCAQVADFIKEQQVDADGNPLDAAATEESCRYIMGNVEIQNAYRFKAKERLLGEPYWQVLKNMKPDERAAWRERHGIPEPKPVETATKPGEAAPVAGQPAPKAPYVATPGAATPAAPAGTPAAPIGRPTPAPDAAAPVVGAPAATPASDPAQ